MGAARAAVEAPAAPLEWGDLEEDSPTAIDATSGLGSRALRYTVLILVARVVSRVIALVTVVAIANALNDSQFGELQTAVTYTALVGAITDIGFTALYVREGAREPHQLSRFFNNVASIKVFLVAVSLPMLAFCLWFSGIESLLLPSFALLILSGYSLLLRSSLYALQRLGFEILEIVPETVVILVMALIGWRIHAGTGFFIWTYVAGYAFATVYFIVVLWRLRILRPVWQLDIALFRSWIRAGIPLAITYVLTTVYFKVDVPILQHFRPYSEVGWYTLAYRPFEALLFIPATLRTVIFPVLSIYYRGAPDRVLVTGEKFFKGLAIMGWPISVGLFLLAQQFTDLLLPYPQSAAALRILALAVAFMFVDNTFAAVLNAIDRQKLYAGVALSGLVVNFVLNIILIPRWGYLAASWDTVVTEVVLVTAGWLALRRVLGTLRVVHVVWKPVVAGLVMGGFVVLANPQGRVALLVVTALAAALYALVLYILRIADAEEMAILRRALRLRGAPAEDPPAAP
jgi:O-antigen/teichoic acid export membrane protein